MTQRAHSPRGVDRRPRLRSGLAVSIMLHATVLAGLAQVAGLSPLPSTQFDVFAADPVDAAPPPPPQIATIHRETRTPRPARSAARAPQPAPAATKPRPAVSATQVPPETTPPAAVIATAEPPPSPPSFAEMTVATSPEPPRAATEPPPTEAVRPPAPTPAAALEPVPALPLTAAPSAPAPDVVGSMREAEAELVAAAAPAPAPAPAPPPATTGAAETIAASPPPSVDPPAAAPLPPSVAKPIPPTSAVASAEATPPAVLVTASVSEPASTGTSPKSTPDAAAVSAPAAEPLAVSPPITAASPPRAHAPLAPATARPSAVARAEAAPATISSSIGLGLGRLRIRLDGAATRVTDRAVESISGTLVGGAPAGVQIDVDGRTSEPKLEGRAFTATVNLLPGVNRVRVVASDAHGAKVEEVVSIEYVPSGPEVVLTSPRDGLTLGPDDPPVIVVEGQVSDTSVSSVWIVANERRVAVRVTDGRFRRIVPVLEPAVRVRAEPPGNGRASATVTVQAAAAIPAVALVLDEWPRPTVGAPRVTVAWRQNPAALDGATAPFPMNVLTADTGEATSDLFYLRNARAGVYTFYLTYRPGAAQAVRPYLYVAGAERARPLPPINLDASGRAVLARVLLPHGVLWEEDDWFSGRGATGDTVTKFRFPEGVTWTERVGTAGR